MKKIFMLLTVIVAICFAFTGCENDRNASNKQPMDVKLLVEKHANSDVDAIQTVFDLEEYKTRMSSFLSGGAHISGCEVDGRPFLFLDAEIEAVDDRLTDAKKAQIAEDSITSIATEVAKVEPLTSEVDVLEAFMTVAVNVETDSQIVYIGSGISTTGFITMTEKFRESDFQKIIAELKAQEAIPSLEGINVLWYGCGQLTGGDQMPLDLGAKKHLRDFWRALLEEAGANVEMIDANFASGNETDYEGWPEVTPVNFGEDKSVTWGGELPGEGDVAMIYEDRISFEPDTAQFLNERKASETIKNIYQAMLSSPEYNLAIVGTTAGDSLTKHSLDLSQKRAIAIANKLQEMGITKGRITTIGLGNQDPWHIEGLGTGSEAAPNRKVVLLDADSSLVKKLLKKEEILK